MATFSKDTFSAAAYATFRPVYPKALYDTILSYHKGEHKLCVDLGCGHGLVTRAMADHFDRVIGTDPSDGMIAQARSLTSLSEFPNVSYQKATAENLSAVDDGSVDMVVAGQAAHWFDYPRLFPELRRIMSKNGTLAFWGYKDFVFVDFPKATAILHDFAHGNGPKKLGPFWPQPGRSIVEDKLRAIAPPEDDWTDIERIEYDPDTKGPGSGQGTRFLERRVTLGQCKAYIRTWSSWQNWKDEHPEIEKRAAGGNGDIVDEVFDIMSDAESWPNENMEVTMEWGSGLLLARFIA